MNNQKPIGYNYKISSYFKSKLGKALVLDHSVNRPNFVNRDFGKSLTIFHQKYPNISKNPKKWGDKHPEYETKLIPIYGITREMTSQKIAKNRYLELKKKLG